MVRTKKVAKNEYLPVPGTIRDQIYLKKLFIDAKKLNFKAKYGIKIFR
jgi:hypothetical protein